MSFAQLGAALLGGLLVAASPRGRAGRAGRMAGGALLAAAVVPSIERAIRRTGAARRRVASSASITIERPVPEVFSFFKDFESFPRVIGALRSVVDYQDGRSHWEAFTTSGEVAAWDVVVTKYVPYSVIAWESVPRSVVELFGVVRFTALGPSCTQIDIQMTYRPMRTSLRQAMQALVNRRPAQQLYAALERARFYLESLPAPLVDDMPAPAES